MEKGTPGQKSKLAKRYLKCDYKVHVSPASRVPDHCAAFAHSYPRDPDYISDCDHDQNIACDRCELFPDVVHEIESDLEEVQYTKEEKEMKYEVSRAKKKLKHERLICSALSTKMKHDLIP